jgi:hypothetical protein
MNWDKLEAAMRQRFRRVGGRERYDDRYDDDYGQGSWVPVESDGAPSGRIWKFIAIFSVFVAGAAIYAFISGKGIYDFIVPEGKVLQTATTTLLRIERESQLVTTRAFVQAVVRQKDVQWYGNAEIIRIVPATIHYAVNLAEIDRNRMEYDESSRTLFVPLPDVKVISIDPDLANSELIRNLDVLRSEAMSGNPLEDSTEKMVRPRLEELGNSSEIIRMAKDQAVASVRQLLESALDAVGMKIRVKPYFKNEGKDSSR